MSFLKVSRRNPGLFLLSASGTMIQNQIAKFPFLMDLLIYMTLRRIHLIILMFIDPVISPPLQEWLLIEEFHSRVRPQPPALLMDE
jgi:hypothetical protein